MMSLSLDLPNIFGVDIWLLSHPVHMYYIGPQINEYKLILSPIDIPSLHCPTSLLYKIRTYYYYYYWSAYVCIFYYNLHN